MTPAEELWYAVVHQCNTWRDYRIGVAGSRLTLSREAKPDIYVEPDATGGWLVVDGCDTVAVRNEADSAVWFAVERICQ